MISCYLPCLDHYQHSISLLADMLLEWQGFTSRDGSGADRLRDSIVLVRAYEMPEGTEGVILPWVQGQNNCHV